MCFLEHTLGKQCTLDALVREPVVAVNHNVANLYLLLFVNVHVKNHHVLVGHVVALLNLYDGILVALVVEIALGENLCTVSHVGVKGHSLHHA